MFTVLQVVTVFLASIAMSMALAHALEFPGKLRLDRETYLAVQTIYYPGFTIGGIGEGLALIATLVLLFYTPADSRAFPWVLTAFIAIVAMHAVFWFMTQPTNKFWLRNQKMGAAGAKFFSVDPTQARVQDDRDTYLWKKLRDRWEYSHVIRAVLSGITVLSLLIALAS